MAATKSAKKTTGAKKASPRRKRQEPAATGRSPEAVPVASHIAPGGLKRTKEGNEVAARAANPQASRAGVIVERTTPEASDDPLAKVTVDVIDGARAVVHVPKTDPLNQSQLFALRKLIDQAIQETY